MDLKVLLSVIILLLGGKAVMLLGLPANHSSTNLQLEWRVLTSVSPHRYFSNKFEIKFDFKLLDMNNTEFVDISGLNSPLGKINFFDIGMLILQLTNIYNQNQTIHIL